MSLTKNINIKFTFNFKIENKKFIFKIIGDKWKKKTLFQLFFPKNYFILENLFKKTLDFIRKSVG